ncbi:MAG: TIR domain-containing protein [Saprospiraceae bacterium]|nr:TIR domain-containing protein [Saprospiraceae bacterium]
MAWSGVKRRVFISYFNRDKDEVEKFINYYGESLGIFTWYAVGINDNDIINSTNTDYIMNIIRKDYLKDSTVTIVMMGSCTHSRRFIDWEIKSSLRQGDYTPNGLMGIVLPSQNNSALLPPRFELNWNSSNNNAYARYYRYPYTADELGVWIDDAYFARSSRNHLINNPQEMMRYSSVCKVHGVTH